MQYNAVHDVCFEASAWGGWGGAYYHQHTWQVNAAIQQGHSQGNERAESRVSYPAVGRGSWLAAALPWCPEAAAAAVGAAVGPEMRAAAVPLWAHWAGVEAQYTASPAVSRTLQWVSATPFR